MTQFLRDQASDSEEVVIPLMLDGTYLSRNSMSGIRRIDDEPERFQENGFDVYHGSSYRPSLD